MGKYANMSDEEFFAEIERLYGKDWTPADLEQNKELADEFMERVGTGH